MANRLYFFSSIFFVAGASVAIYSGVSLMNLLNLFGSLLFFAAASFGMLKSKQ